MYILDSIRRPTVEFDPANAEHRALYAKFVKTNSWAHSPIRFSTKGQFLDQPSYLNTVILEYYMNRDQQLVKKLKTMQPG